MKKILPLFGVILQIEGRFDLENFSADPDLECPPKCVCSRWSCIDELDFAHLQEENKVYSLTNDQFDERFRCWKHCCKKQGVVVSTCDRNVCQKCCNEQCVDIKSMIRMRRKFASKSCNTCLQQHCAFSQEYISVFTTRSCRGLFNKYSTTFNESITFQVEAERDLRIFLYDEPLSLLRSQMRKRRDVGDEDDAIPAEFEAFLREQYSESDDYHEIDVLDDPEEDLSDAFAAKVMVRVLERVRREVSGRLVREVKERNQEMVDARKQAREKEREEIKLERKAKRVKKRLRKKSQKLLYAKNKASEEHVQEQIAILEEKLGVSVEAPSDNEMLHEANMDFEESEEIEGAVDDRLYDYRDEPENSRETKKAEMKSMRKAWREEQKKLDSLSETFRRLESALLSEQVKAEAQASLQSIENMQRDVFDESPNPFDEADAIQEDMLNAVLGMYGWEELGNSDPLGTETLLLIQKNLQETYQDQKQKNIDDDRDTADWKKARWMHEVPESKVAEIKVKNHLKEQLHEKSKTAKSISFLQNMLGESADQSRSKVEEGFADEERGIHDSILQGGWIQIGLGSSNNTACDLKSCQTSSYKRCIGVLRKKFPNLLSSHKPQEITVSVTGRSTERVLTVDISDKGATEKTRIFEVVVDDPTIAQLNNMAVCTTKGSRGKLSFCCGNEKDGINNGLPGPQGRQSFSYFTDFRRMVDCQFSCLSSNCRQECMPDTECDECLQHNCGAYSTDAE